MSLQRRELEILFLEIYSIQHVVVFYLNQLPALVANLSQRHASVEPFCRLF
jgi:hypothetical protein